MTIATSTHTGVGATKPSKNSFRLGAPWLFIVAVFGMLIAVLALTPDGVAEPVQALAGWLIGGGVAAFAVIAVVTGLERLLDCEAD